MKGVRIDILGKSTSTKKVEKGIIHTMPVLITCGCRNVKERLGLLRRFNGRRNAWNLWTRFVRRGDNGLWKKGVLYKN